MLNKNALLEILFNERHLKLVLFFCAFPLLSVFIFSSNKGYMTNFVIA